MIHQLTQCEHSALQRAATHCHCRRAPQWERLAHRALVQASPVCRPTAPRSAGQPRWVPFGFAEPRCRPAGCSPAPVRLAGRFQPIPAMASCPARELRRLRCSQQQLQDSPAGWLAQRRPRCLPRSQSPPAIRPWPWPAAGRARCPCSGSRRLARSAHRAAVSALLRTQAPWLHAGPRSCLPDGARAPRRCQATGRR